MTITLDRLSACFEGVIPSVVATTAADGTPNVSYLSHVIQVDAQRIALSNQFFAKTAANVRANRSASLLLVCPRTGEQFLLDIRWETVVDHGPIFDRVDHALKGAIAQTGMAAIMRLKAIDIFLVDAIHAVPAPLNAPPPLASPPPQPQVRDVLAMLTAIAQKDSVEGVVDALVDSACALTDSDHAMVFVHEPERATLIAVTSRGYAEPGFGAEVPVGELLIGQAAASGATLKISDLTRIERMGRAAGAGAAANDRLITLPRLDGALSQIAVPLKTKGALKGVLFVEAARRLAFDETAAAGLEALAREAATALESAGERADTAAAPAGRRDAPAPSGATIRVRVHAFDDSVFIGDRYVIKGVAGRLLAWLIDHALAEGRSSFTNRELRKDTTLRLPDFKDNLETRLLLLARRLEEHDFPIRLHRPGRGVMDLEVRGQAVLERRE